MIDHTNGQINKFSFITLFVDGGCEPKNPGGVCTAGWVLYNKNNILAEQGKVVVDGGDLATNNYGEYNALFFALNWLIEQKWKGELVVKADSKLLVEQVNSRWKCKAEHLAEVRTKIWDQLNKLNLKIVNEDSPLAGEGKQPVTLTWIPREKNAYANDLCRDAYKKYKGLL